jgi:integrase
MRGIYLRGNIYWFRPPMKNGVRPERITLETTDPAEAVTRANEIRDNPTLTTSAQLSVEIENAAAHKLRMHEWTETSARSKKSILLAFADTQPAHFAAADVTTAIMQKYHDRQLRKLAPSTVSGYMMTFRSFFNWAVDVAKIMRRNPMDGVKVVRTTGNRREDFADFALRDKLIVEAPTDELRLILFMGFHGGLRKKEIIEARPFWFNLNAGMLELRKTATMNFKDGEERSIPMTREFVSFMRRFGLSEPYVLAPNVKAGKSIYRYDFRKPFTDYMKAQGVPWITPHIMRHTFASLLASSGVSIFKIATWLGDDVATVQKHYAKLLPGDKDIEKAFGDRQPTPSVVAAA